MASSILILDALSILRAEKMDKVVNEHLEWEEIVQVLAGDEEDEYVAPKLSLYPQFLATASPRIRQVYVPIGLERITYMAGYLNAQYAGRTLHFYTQESEKTSDTLGLLQHCTDVTIIMISDDQKSSRPWRKEPIKRSRKVSRRHRTPSPPPPTDSETETATETEAETDTEPDVNGNNLIAQSFLDFIKTPQGVNMASELLQKVTSQ